MGEGKKNASPASQHGDGAEQGGKKKLEISKRRAGGAREYPGKVGRKEILKWSAGEEAALKRGIRLGRIMGRSRSLEQQGGLSPDCY